MVGQCLRVLRVGQRGGRHGGDRHHEAQPPLVEGLALGLRFQIDRAQHLVERHERHGQHEAAGRRSGGDPAHHADAVVQHTIDDAAAHVHGSAARASPWAER